MIRRLLLFFLPNQTPDITFDAGDADMQAAVYQSIETQATFDGSDADMQASPVLALATLATFDGGDADMQSSPVLGLTSSAIIDAGDADMQASPALGLTTSATFDGGNAEMQAATINTVDTSATFDADDADMQAAVYQSIETQATFDGGDADMQVDAVIGVAAPATFDAGHADMQSSPVLGLTSSAIIDAGDADMQSSPVLGLTSSTTFDGGDADLQTEATIGFNTEAVFDGGDADVQVQAILANCYLVYTQITGEDPILRTCVPAGTGEATLYGHPALWDGLVWVLAVCKCGITQTDPAIKRQAAFDADDQLIAPRPDGPTTITMATSAGGVLSLGWTFIKRPSKPLPTAFNIYLSINDAGFGFDAAPAAVVPHSGGSRYTMTLGPYVTGTAVQAVVRPVTALGAESANTLTATAIADATAPDSPAGVIWEVS